MCESIIGHSIYPIAIEEFENTVIGKKKLIWNTLNQLQQDARVFTFPT